jgi:hypothetical protein
MRAIAPSAPGLGWQAKAGTPAGGVHRHVLCLLIGISGSMPGLGVAIAAVATASVVLAADGRLAPGIIAFSDTTVPQGWVPAGRAGSSSQNWWRRADTG